MKQIVIAPYSQKLKDKENPKNYPYWNDLIKFLSKDFNCVQIGITGHEQIPYTSKIYYNLKLSEIENLINESHSWISVDSFLPHLVNCSKNIKPGIVLWSLSDPKIFGYEYNLNILKDRKYLNSFQFVIWEMSRYDLDAYFLPQDIYPKIKMFLGE